MLPALFCLLCLASPTPGAFAGGVAEAHAQEVSLGGGVFIGGATGNAAPLSPRGEVGVAAPLTERITAQAGLSYRDVLSVTAGARAAVLGGLASRFTESLSPYVSLMGGRTLLSGDAPGVAERWVASVGAGSLVDVSPSVSLRGGVEARTFFDEPGGITGGLGVAPSVGVVYRFGGGESPEPLPALRYAEQVDTVEGRRGRWDSGWSSSTSSPRASGTPPLGGAEVRGDKSLLPGSVFVMGLTDEDPLSMQRAGRRRISVSPFMIDRYEVSNADYGSWLKALSVQERAAMQPDSSTWASERSVAPEDYFSGAAYANHPVVSVTHRQAAAYCRAQGGKLPTEAQWEYAARSGYIGRVYPWGGFSLQRKRGGYHANFKPSGGGYGADGYVFTAPVDEYAASAWGLYQMAGNVAEWVRDAWHPSYRVLSDVNPLHEEEGATRRVVRGGSWAADDYALGVGLRGEHAAAEGSPRIGFRCVYGPGGGQ